MCYDFLYVKMDNVLLCKYYTSIYLTKSLLSTNDIEIFRSFELARFFEFLIYSVAMFIYFSLITE